MQRLLLLALIGLAACATPRERCIAGATKDIRVLDRLIAESQGNIQRGYGYGTERYTTWDFVVCGRRKDGSFHYCWEPYDRTRRVPVAVDLTAEQRQLDAMVRKRAELARQLGPQIAACNAAYPVE